MKAPTPPNKKIHIKHSAQAPFDELSLNAFFDKKMPWDQFLNWAQSQLPENPHNTTIEVVEDWDYDDMTVSLELAWETLEDNPHYDREMKKYRTKLVKWKKQCQNKK